MEPDRRRSPDKELRRDIRRVTSILGETLARTEGDDLLALVEQVRAHAKEGRLDQLPELRPGDDHPAGAGVHGVLPPRQHHRAGPPRPRPHPRAVSRRAAGSSARSPGSPRPASTRPRSPRCSSRSPSGRCSPPTRRRSPGARPSTSFVASPRCWGSRTAPRRTRRLEEAVELLWLTDEIRIEPPEPTDEARNVVYYLEGLSGGALPDVLEELRDRLVPLGVDLPPDVRPLRFGTWVGGDRDGNPHVTPATTREVLTLQAVHGIRLLRTLVDRLRRDLSVSDHVSSVSGEISARIRQVLPGLPEVEPRYRRLNAEEPYRLFLTCVHVRLALTEQRIIDGGRHVPGRDYADDTELLDDLLLLHRSVRRAPGSGRRLRRGRAAGPHRRRDRPDAGDARRARALRQAPRGRRAARRPRRRARYAVRRARPCQPAQGAAARS